MILILRYLAVIIEMNYKTNHLMVKNQKRIYQEN
jgi:hypothetical protein